MFADFGGEVVALGVRGEGVGEDGLAEVVNALAQERGGVGEAADELCRRGEGEIGEVVEDEDLAVALGAGRRCRWWGCRRWR